MDWPHKVRIHGLRCAIHGFRKYNYTYIFPAIYMYLRKYPPNVIFLLMPYANTRTALAELRQVLYRLFCITEIH